MVGPSWWPGSRRPSTGIPWWASVLCALSHGPSRVPAAIGHRLHRPGDWAGYRDVANGARTSAVVSSRSGAIIPLAVMAFLSEGVQSLGWGWNRVQPGHRPGPRSVRGWPRPPPVGLVISGVATASTYRGRSRGGPDRHHDMLGRLAATAIAADCLRHPEDTLGLLIRTLAILRARLRPPRPGRSTVVPHLGHHPDGARPEWAGATLGPRPFDRGAVHRPHGWGVAPQAASGHQSPEHGAGRLRAVGHRHAAVGTMDHVMAYRPLPARVSALPSPQGSVSPVFEA